MAMRQIPSRSQHFLGVDALTGNNIFTEDGDYWFGFDRPAHQTPAIPALRRPDGFAPTPFPPLVVGQELSEYLKNLPTALAAFFGQELKESESGQLSFEEACTRASGFSLVCRLDHEPIGMAGFYFLRAVIDAWNMLAAQVNPTA